MVSDVAEIPLAELAADLVAGPHRTTGDGLEQPALHMLEVRGHQLLPRATGTKAHTTLIAWSSMPTSHHGFLENLD
jgi:hypothetical protein